MITTTDAEALQQRGERKKGQEAIPLLQAAASKFRDALRLGFQDLGERSEAHFGAAWCLALCGGAVMEASSALPDGQISWETEAHARASACNLYIEAVQVLSF